MSPRPESVITFRFICAVKWPSEPIYAPILLGLGLQELSTNPQAIPMVKSAIRALRFEDARNFLADVLESTTMEEIEQTGPGHLRRSFK